MKAQERQATMFELPPRVVEPAEPKAEHATLAQEIPNGVRFGTMSWSYAGWRGLVYAANADPKRLAGEGLTAYAKHPLLRLVELDRPYYEPLPTDEFQRLAEQVPGEFRFIVKAHEDCVVQRFPAHPRYGKKRGETNHRYLDAAHATDAVVGPAAAGLGSKLAAILFQFPPQDVGAPDAFASDLGEFLARLPKGIAYCVELRNPELLTPAYAAALLRTGALHCHSVWGAMPSVMTQARLIPPPARRPLLVRWLMRRGDNHEDAGSRFAPFNRLLEEDVPNRRAIATLVAKALQKEVPTLVLVDNKAEGSAPESIVRLARAIAEEWRSNHLGPSEAEKAPARG
jgi:uncharacterized protein YecE (DUF72 family)